MTSCTHAIPRPRDELVKTAHCKEYNDQSGKAARASHGKCGRMSYGVPTGTILSFAQSSLLLSWSPRDRSRSLRRSFVRLFDMNHSIGWAGEARVSSSLTWWRRDQPEF